MRYNVNPIEEELNEKLWTIYAWWASVLILKMMSLTWITGRVRVAKQVIHSEEDSTWMKGGGHVILCPSGGGHPAVDRIRSAHYNDLAIVLPYLLIVPIWLTTLPSFLTARTLMLCFATSNVLSTLIQLEVLDAPNFCQTISRVCSSSILTYICFACMARYFDLA